MNIWKRWYLKRTKPGLDVPWTAQPRRGSFEYFLWRRAMKEK